MSIVFWPLFTSICFNLKSRKLMLPALHFFIPSVLQIVKETIGVCKRKSSLAVLSNCPFVYINFDFSLVNKVASLSPLSMGIQSLLSSISLSYLLFYWQLVFAKRIIFRHDKQTPFAEVFWSIQLYILTSHMR